MGASSDSIGLPEPFSKAANDMLNHAWRPELSVDEMPAPQKISPFACAIAADVLVGDEELGTGRLVLLHDPRGNDAWQGTFRCVSFARAEIDTEMGTDPLLPTVGWSWLIDSLTVRQANFVAPSGTVTSVSSQSFGAMEDDPTRSEVEIRASWTPLLDDDGSGLEAHLSAWGDLLCTVAGLPPLPSGVVMMPQRRSR